MFDGIIGHGRVKDFLGQSMRTGRIAHAYLFVGPTGVGKKTLARAFIETLLHGEKKPTHALEAYPDVTFVARLEDEKTGAKKLVVTIEQIRELRERLSYSSLLPSWKIAMVDEADTMTLEAANALLKTLEEPRGQTVIMLFAADLRRVPQTVQSRTQVVRFGLVPRRALEDGLIATGVPKERAALVARVARGRPGAALTLARDGVAFEEFQTATAERGALLAWPIHLRLQWIEERAKKKDGLAGELRLWHELLRDELLHTLGTSELVTFEHEKSNDTVSSFKFQVSRIKRLMESEDALRHHIDPRLALEHFLCV